MLTKLRLKTARVNLPLLAVTAVVVVIVISSLVWGLGNSTKGLSPAEQASVHISQSLGSISDRPLNAPYHIVQFAEHSTNPNSHSLARLGSVLIALVILFCFYYVLKHWFGSYIAVLGAILLCGTPLFMILARSATPAIMLFSPIIPAAIFIWLEKTKTHIGPVLLLLALSVAISLYTPGVFWILLLALVICYSQVVKSIGRASNIWLSAAVIIFVVILAPLVWSMATSLHLTQNALLIPRSWQSLSELVKSAFLIPASLIWQARYTSDYYVGRVPMVSFSVLIFALLGIYAMLKQAKKESITMLGILLSGCVLAIINNSVMTLGLVLPILIVFSAAGLRYLYVEWQTVFPKNPLPQALAIVLMVAVVGQYFAYGLNYTHYVWPHTQRTKTVYVIK